MHEIYGLQRIVENLPLAITGVDCFGTRIQIRLTRTEHPCWDCTGHDAALRHPGRRRLRH